MCQRFGPLLRSVDSKSKQGTIYYARSNCAYQVCYCVLEKIQSKPANLFRLLRIVSCILRDMYGINPPSRIDHLNLALKYSTALHDWRRDLAEFLGADLVDTLLLIPVFQRQRNVLNFAYWH